MDISPAGVDAAPDSCRAQLEAAVAVRLGLAVERTAQRLDVPRADVLLAVHLKVRSTLTGDQEVVAGIRRPDEDRAACYRFTVSDGSWTDLIRHAARQGALPTDPYEQSGTVLDLGGELRDDLDPSTSCCVAFGWHLEVLRLWIGYRSDQLDLAAAERILGYYVVALELLTADPDDSHLSRSLLSPQELRFQLVDLAGPARTLPDRRLHELFEEQVRRRPDAVAVECADRTWTYDQLNRLSNRLGRRLRATGVGREDVVAVILERDLPWAASVLAVLKAGGVYLPIEPTFPPERITAMLRRSGCRTVVAGLPASANLERAIQDAGDLHVVPVEAPPGEVLADSAAVELDTDLGLAVTADQLAYIFFTSGSTGEPKGAMCEHAGFLNHVLAKVEDLELTGDDVLAQIAPQCFDISLWQLVSSWLVGGRTLIVPQNVILDVGRFVDSVVEAGVGVLQLVPSYLDVVLAYLEKQPRPLPRLHHLSVTGEALNKELVVRWFAAYPAIALVNAYGLTETCDDTNHEVMTAVPVQAQVPLGHPVRNVGIAIVDESLRPVPLGAPGEIVFSGVCVGRGYINDPDRTRLAFLSDPSDPSDPTRRIYLSGDFGRWLPDGRLAFLGRRDAQVKVRGFRIEIGEIESRLLQIPAIRDAAVIVTESPRSGCGLAGFYSGEDTSKDLVREILSASLPDYMVPATLQQLPALPLTANGKIDRAALGAWSAEAGPGSAIEELSGPTECRLAADWAHVLGLPAEQINRSDHFFEVGGTSLSAIRLVLRMKSSFSLIDVLQHPVLADLAALIDARLISAFEGELGMTNHAGDPVGQR